MNGDTIKLDKNTYAVIDELGSARIVSTINTNNQETMKTILLKENDVEEIEHEIKIYKTALKGIKSDTIYEKIFNAFIWILLIAMFIIFWPIDTMKLIPLSITGVFSYALVKIINYTLHGSKRKRKKTKKHIEEELPNLEKLLETTKKELEKLKEETHFTELTNIKDNTSNEQSYNYVYKYDPNNCNLENIQPEEINKEINVMKLSRIKRNPFQKNNL